MYCASAQQGFFAIYDKVDYNKYANMKTLGVMYMKKFFIVLSAILAFLIIFWSIEYYQKDDIYSQEKRYIFIRCKRK